MSGQRKDGGARELEGKYFETAAKNVRLLVPDIDADRAEAIAGLCLLPILKLTGETSPEFFGRILAARTRGEQS